TVYLGAKQTATATPQATDETGRIEVSGWPQNALVVSRWVHPNRISLFDAAYPDGQPLPEAMLRSSADIISKSAISGGFGTTGVKPPCATILGRWAGGGSSR